METYESTGESETLEKEVIESWLFEISDRCTCLSAPVKTMTCAVVGVSASSSGNRHDSTDAARRFDDVGVFTTVALDGAENLSVSNYT
jgi:hypothetical protein